jgi:hypothetical protein
MGKELARLDFHSAQQPPSRAAFSFWREVSLFDTCLLHRVRQLLHRVHHLPVVVADKRSKPVMTCGSVTGAPRP